MYIILRIVRVAFGLLAAWQLYGILNVFAYSINTFGFETPNAKALIIIKAVIVVVFGGLFFAIRSIINRLHKKRAGVAHPALMSPLSL